MNESHKLIVLWFVFAAVLGCLLFSFCHCSPGLPSPSDTAQVAAYEAEQLACIAEAGDKADADMCRNTVKAKYGRPYDAGRQP